MSRRRRRIVKSNKPIKPIKRKTLHNRQLKTTRKQLATRKKKIQHQIPKSNQLTKVKEEIDDVIEDQTEVIIPPDNHPPTDALQSQETHSNADEEGELQIVEDDTPLCDHKDGANDSDAMNWEMKQHQCPICSKQLSSASSLDRHMLVHSGERPFRCRLCHMSFTTNGNMHRHMRTHSEADLSESGLDLRKELYCSVCGKSFLCKKGLQSHMQTHPNDPIRCHKCDVISSNYHAHLDHKCENSCIVGAKTSAPGKCHQCGFQDLTFMDFATNKFSHVSKSFCEQNIKRPNSAFHVFECEECKKSFPCGRALKLHQRAHEAEVGTFCPTCHCDFASPSFLQLHQLKHRPVEHGGKEDFLALLNLQTKQSQASLLQSSLMSSHIKEDHFDSVDYFVHGKKLKDADVTNNNCSHNNNNNDFADIQSILSLTSKAPLISSQTSPVAMHSTSSNFKPKSPTIADATAAASPEDTEVDSSGNDDIYSCKICSQRFKTMSTLKQHRRLHLHQKAGSSSSYSCHICSYVSVDKSTLIRHLRTHNGERPFQCVICKYAFTTKANCERHVRKRHKKLVKSEIRSAMQYNPNMSSSATKSVPDPVATTDVGGFETVCKYCGVDFKFNRVLRHHLRSLHNSCNRKPFSCKICKFGFSTKNNCIRHVLKQHPNLKDKLRSVVIPNSQMQRVNKRDSSTDNSNSSTITPDESQPLDLHCTNSTEPLNLQTEKVASESNSNETVIAAESLVSLSEAPPLQEEPLDLVASALDLSCKPLAAVGKGSENKSVFNAPPSYIYKPIGFIDLTVSKASTSTAVVSKIQIAPLSTNTIVTKTTEPSNKIDVSNTTCQKQRSFTCVYCEAGFTLKSNMERHIKRKHPEFARPTRSRNFIPSMVPQNVQKQASPTLSDKTRDALRNVLSSKVQQVPIFKTAESFPKVGSTFKIVGSAHSFLSPIINQVPGQKILNLSLDLSDKTDKTIDVSSTVLKTNGLISDENCSDLASVSSVICTANSPQINQYLGKPEKVAEESSEEEDACKKNDGTTCVSCPFCDRKFPWTSSLRRHILTHTGQKPFKCPKCTLWFTTKSNCERHLIRKHGHKGDLITRSVPDRPYKCNHCLTSTFSTQGNLRKHFYLKHWTKSYMGMNNKVKTPEKEPSPTEEHSYSQPERKLPFVCNYCDNRFESQSGLGDHMSHQHSGVVYMCYLCRKIFDGHEDCSDHFKTSHSLVYSQIDPTADVSTSCESTSSSSGSSTSMACMLCFQKMASADTLQQHFKKHLLKSDAQKVKVKGKVKNSLLYLFSQSPVEKKNPDSQEEDSDLIQNLLGIHDSKMIDEMLVSADSAARLLGVKEV